MPYIKQEERDLFDESLYKIYLNIKTPGQLNYVISYFLNNQFKDSPSYSKINELMGVLSCVSMEFYRRVAVNYEEIKKVENGEIYI